MFTEDHPLIATPNGARHTALAALAKTGPVHRITVPPDTPAWLVTGFAEARAIMADERVMKAGANTTPQLAALPPEIVDGLHNNMIVKNPPDHTRLRRLVNMAFTRRRIETLEPKIRRICGQVLENVVTRLDGGETVDLLDDYAYPLSITVFCELLGVEPRDHDRMRELAQVMLAGGVIDLESFLSLNRELFAFLQEQVAEKRQTPGDDLLSALIQAREGEDRLSENELTSMVSLLILAGYETTVNQICNAVLLLLSHPEQRELLRARPELAASAFEEAMRYDTVTQIVIPAVTAAEVQVGDVTIPAGDVVLVSLLAANRDPSRFSDPDTFDITRRSDTHIAFGHGIHRCLGAPLAQVEGKIALEVLFDTLPDIELAVPADSVERMPSLIINGVAALPVRRPTR